MRASLIVASLSMTTLIFSVPSQADQIFEQVDSLCISKVFPNLPTESEIEAAGFRRQPSIPASPMTAYTYADKGWPDVFIAKGIRLRFRQEKIDISGTVFKGFVCELNVTHNDLEKMRSDVIAAYGDPSKSIVGDNYGEYYWSIEARNDARREIVIDSMSNDLTYYSFNSKN